MDITQNQFNIGLDGCYNSTETVIGNLRNNSHSRYYNDRVSLIRGR